MVHTDKRVFLITGKPRVGKSTSVKNIINHLGPDICGGFYTEEIRDSSDRVGFKCVSVDGQSQEIANVELNSPIRVGRYGIDIKSFEDFVIPLIETSLKSKKVIVLDEIGFMQMLSIPFQELVQDMMAQSNHIILGTIPVDSHPVIDKLRSHPKVSIISMDHVNRVLMTEEIPNMIIRALEK